MNTCQEFRENYEHLVYLNSADLSLGTIHAIADSDFIANLYKKKHPSSLHQRIISSLTHEIYSEETAKRLWEGVTLQRENLNLELGRDVGISVAALDYFVNIEGILIDPKIIEDKKSQFISDAATRDDLTGLYTKDIFDVYLEKHLDQSKRDNRDLCLLVIDIDNFKIINDTLGHLAGDNFLIKISEIIESQIRKMDLGARIGGDEFAVVFPNSNKDIANEVVQRIEHKIEDTCQFSDKGIIELLNRSNLSVSVGLANYLSLNCDEVDLAKTLFKEADRSMYLTKKNKSKFTAPLRNLIDTVSHNYSC